MNWKEFLQEHGMKIAFAAVFGLAGLLIVTLGFVKTVFIAALAAGGYFAGRVAGDKEMVRRFLDRYRDGE